jgi:hypothetical protein
MLCVQADAFAYSKKAAAPFGATALIRKGIDAA